MGGHKVAPNPALVDSYPDVYLTTGLVAENHAREAACLARGAGRLRAAQPPARDRGDRRGRFDDEIVPSARHGAGNGDRSRRHVRDRRRAAARHVARSAREAEAGVPRQGHGHRRQLVADERRRRGGRRDVGERAQALGLQPLARFVGFATAGVEPERFGIGPVPAVRKVLSSRGPRRSTRSISSSSTKRSPRRCSPACASCRSIPIG